MKVHVEIEISNAIWEVLWRMSLKYDITMEKAVEWLVDDAAAYAEMEFESAKNITPIPEGNIVPDYARDRESDGETHPLP